MEKMGKEFLTVAFTSFFVVLSPIIPLYLLIVIMVIADSKMKVWMFKSTDRKHLISYKVFWYGIGRSLFVYSLVLGLIYGIDLYIGRHIIKAFEADRFDLMVTRSATLGIMYYEFKSIDRSYEEAKKKSIIKGIKNILKDFKKVKDEVW